MNGICDTWEAIANRMCAHDWRDEGFERACMREAQSSRKVQTSAMVLKRNGQLFF